MRNRLGLAVLVACTLTPAVPAAEIVWETARFRAVLGEDAVWRNLVDRRTGRDYAAADKPVSLAAVRIGGQWHVARRAALTGRELTLGFSGCDTQCTYAVDVQPDWIAWRLDRLAGARPTELMVARLGVTLTEHIGAILNGAWNEQFAVCLRGINLQTHGSAAGSGAYAELTATSQDEPGPRLEGSGVALLAGTPAEVRTALRRLAAAYDLPRNEADGGMSRDLPWARQSYWFLGFGESEADQVIDYCRRTGFRQVMLSSGAWCAQVGHYTINTSRYPDGLESLRRTVARLHAAGILVGLHTFASKISKTDSYVTPVPDRGFCVDRTAVLARAVDASVTELPTKTDLSQWPGSPVAKQKVWEGGVRKHQEVILDDEIIGYQAIGPEGKWDTFLGCQRGAWKTRPAAHAADAVGRHYAVDGCINGYIVDLDGPLFEETSSRLAQIFNACDFDMVYFDGSEDVDPRRFHYYAAKAHAVPLGKFTRRPLMHQGGGFGNELWHSFTRDSTVDQYPGTYLGYLQAGGVIDQWPTCKEHIDRSVRFARSCADNFTPGELGWFGINPRMGNYDGLQYDEIEYLMCKSLALNAPISLQTSFAQMERHPLTPDILEIVRRYEALRLSGQVPAADAARAGQLGKDFVLVPRNLSSQGRAAEFVEVQPVAEVAGTRELRAFVGVHGVDAIATLWHAFGRDGTLTLGGTGISAYDVTGVSRPTLVADGRTRLTLDHRRMTLCFAGLSADAARGLLRQARFELRPPDVLWIPAASFRANAGTMVRASRVGVQDPDALSDPVLCSGKITSAGNAASYCEYCVTLPRAAHWTLWARVRYPRGGDMSFGLVRPGEPVTLTGQQVLGNCGMHTSQWHWTGRGCGNTSVPPGERITWRLDAGELVFRVHPREGDGTAVGNPRLDCFCLAEDAQYVPTDADAKRGLAAGTTPSRD